MPLILGTNSIKDTGYDVANSLRFDDDSSHSLTRTFGSGNQKTWTWSAWVKKTANLTTLGNFDFVLFNGYQDNNNRLSIFYSQTQTDSAVDDCLKIFGTASGSTSVNASTSAVYRDNSAWYHVVCAFDTTQATGSNRIKIYVNGVQQTLNFDTTPAQDSNQSINFNQNHTIGNYNTNTASTEFDGYMAEVVFIDGSALDPTSFGEFDEDSPTIWKPKDVSGLTFGTNGFYLDFENASSLGADVSGNSNNFTVNNLTSVDQSTDTCTNNFITMNPLDSYYSESTFSEGNLKIVSSSGHYSPDMGTIGLSSGRWFWEVKIDTTSTEDMIGITGNQRLSPGNSTSHLGGMLYDFAYNSYARFYNNNGYVSYGATFGNGDIIGVALDLDSATNTIQFYKNGSAQGSKNITHVSSTENGFYHVSAGDFTFAASMTFSSNFGSPPYAISSGNADGNGYGNFEYSVPSGYYSINTKNLAEFG